MRITSIPANAGRQLRAPAQDVSRLVLVMCLHGMNDALYGRIGEVLHGLLVLGDLRFVGFRYHPLRPVDEQRDACTQHPATS